MTEWLKKNSTCNAADTGLIPGLERSPGEVNATHSNPLCLGNPMDRGWALKTVGHDLMTKLRHSHKQYLRVMVFQHSTKEYCQREKKNLYFYSDTLKARVAI